MQKREQLIGELKSAFVGARAAQRAAFRAWQTANDAIQDDLSPRQRAERRRIMTSSRRLYFRAARQAWAIDVCLATLKID